MKAIKPLRKGELAKEYGFSYSTFINALYGSPDLRNELKSLGYYKDQKILHIKQIEVIFKHLGCPPNYLTKK